LEKLDSRYIAFALSLNLEADYSICTPEMEEGPKELLSHIPALMISLQKANFGPSCYRYDLKFKPLKGIQAQVSPNRRKELAW
jgi:hypothetical protein